MLRRPATTIKLTPEDILEYDDSVQLAAVKDDFPHVQQEQLDVRVQPSVLKPEPTRDERIGVSRSRD